MPATKINPAIDRDFLVNAMLENLKRLIAKPIRETNGKNRSPDIDSWNKRAGAPKASPYCASSIWCEWEDVCKMLGLKFPMPRTASSQYFYYGVPAKYRRLEGELGQAGDAAVLQNVSDPGHGHLTVVREDQKKGSNTFYTLEFNTNSAGSRDGDGGYAMSRSIVDRSTLNAGKLFRGFTDIPQWILDYNGIGEQEKKVA